MKKRVLWQMAIAGLVFTLAGIQTALAQEQVIDLLTGLPIEKPAETDIVEEEGCQEISRKCNTEKNISGGTTGSTINSPKNTGNCKITLVCWDGMAEVGLPVELGTNEQGVDFGCAAGQAIRMKCAKGESTRARCKLQYKLPAADTLPAEPPEGF